MSTYSDFKTKLISLSDDTYREFSKKTIPSSRPFLGVRIPDIKKLVKDIPPEKIEEFINATPVAIEENAIEENATKEIAIEEVLARGFAIARLPYEKMLEKFDSHVALLDNWCTVDTFVAALRRTVSHHEADFLDKKVNPLLKSSDEFAVRTGLVCLLDFFITPDYLPLIFDRIESTNRRIGSANSNIKSSTNNYYIKMALSWLLAECFIKFPDATYSYLKSSTLDSWTFNKAISKICDSYRVDQATKTHLKTLRKKDKNGR